MSDKKNNIKNEELKQESNEVEVEVIENDAVEEETVEEQEESKEPTLEEQLETALQEKNEMKDKWLRSVAEFENFRKRSIEEKSSWIKNATKQLVLELCDVMDNFERAMQTEAQDHQLDNFRKGIDMIYKQLDGVLKKEGVEKIDAIGKEFDPSFHEALANIPSDLEENKIAAVIQNGYKMNDKLIRPVRVAVSNGEKPAPKENNTKKEK